MSDLDSRRDDSSRSDWLVNTLAEVKAHIELEKVLPDLVENLNERVARIEQQLSSQITSTADLVEASQQIRALGKALCILQRWTAGPWRIARLAAVIVLVPAGCIAIGTSIALGINPAGFIKLLSLLAGV